MAKKQKPTGGARMTQLGKKPLMIWLTPEEHEGIKRAAATEGRSMANYVRQNTLEAVARRLGAVRAEQSS